MEDNTNSTQPSDTQNPEAVSKNILFGSISYSNELEYEKFISNMNIDQAVFILVASANFAQAKGAYNILESETISNAIRTIRKNSEPNETEQ
jgi:hypothetical protein